MAIKDDLLRKGYLPENLPHAFHTESIADHFLANPTNEILSQGSQPARPANYNASKRGMTRRNFAFIHSTTSHDLAEFIFRRWRRIRHFYASSELSLSQPVHTPEGDRAVEITSHTELDTQKLNRLSRYRYIAKTDISRFYHSIYTHSIPWAFHTKEAAKADRSTNSANIFFNRADLIIRLGQDGQTIGIPVGPDASRVLAEVVSTAIDGAYGRRSQDLNVGIIRHVDDVWIGAHTHADAEAALWRYREAIREFELDINENKTRIYSDDFRFSEVWPFELANLLDIAVDSSGRRAPERLRAALEHAFSLAIGTGDEAVIKYAIRYLDQSDLNWAHWETIEPFLKRAAIHFGHTFDYIARVIVWRHLARNDLDIEVWQEILLAILDRHGRLGNDSEVSWAIYMLT